MFRSLFTAASGMIAQQLNLDNIANNLANSSTSGFRRRRLQFQDTLYQNLVMPGSAATQQTNVAAGLQIGLGTKSVASEIIQAQGDFNQTGNPLDLTIQGQGFFQVTLPDGETAYSRSGAFHLDAQGNVVTADGNPISPSITVPTGATAISIGADGTVTVTQPGQTQASQIGNIQLAMFPNPGGLIALAAIYFSLPVLPVIPWWVPPAGTEGLGSLQQGVLEQSNVSVVEEFVQMILAQRSVRSEFTRGKCSQRNASAAEYGRTVTDAAADHDLSLAVLVFGSFAPRARCSAVLYPISQRAISQSINRALNARSAPINITENDIAAYRSSAGAQGDPCADPVRIENHRQQKCVLGAAPL